MANYGTHTQNTYVLTEVEWEVSITVTCISPYRPAQLCGPPEHCDPAAPAEYEFDEFRLFVGKVTILKSTDWTVAEALFGANIWNHLYDNAVADAEENYIGEEVE